MCEVYRYPFKIPLRTRVINLFRLLFTYSFTESLLVSVLRRSSNSFWKKVVPPLYLYPARSYRDVERDAISFHLDISILLDHSTYFYLINDRAWLNVLRLVKPGFNIIDAGANMGYLTLNFARRCSEGIVYSFEPDTETFSRLSENVSRNSFRNIRLFKQALGEKAEQRTLYKMYVNNPGANRILPYPYNAGYGSEVVDVIPLDTFAEDANVMKIDLIKIDVEGFELFVLKGGKKLIERFSPILFIEVAEENFRAQGYSVCDLLDYLRETGYSVLDANTMADAEANPAVNTDIICFHSSRISQRITT